MPFVVTENCIKCKYTDCVEVCPVDCFHEGPNFLVRVTAVEAGVYVSVVDPRGLPAAGEGPAEVIAALKAALGG